MIKIGIAGYGKIGQLRTSILSERDDVDYCWRIRSQLKPEKLMSGIFYASFDALLEADLDASFYLCLQYCP